MAKKYSKKSTSSKNSTLHIRSNSNASSFAQEPKAMSKLRSILKKTDFSLKTAPNKQKSTKNTLKKRLSIASNKTLSRKHSESMSSTKNEENSKKRKFRKCDLSRASLEAISQEIEHYNHEMAIKKSIKRQVTEINKKNLISLKRKRKENSLRIVKTEKNFGPGNTSSNQTDLSPGSLISPLSQNPKKMIKEFGCFSEEAENDSNRGGYTLARMRSMEFEENKLGGSLMAGDSSSKTNDSFQMLMLDISREMSVSHKEDEDVSEISGMSVRNSQNDFLGGLLKLSQSQSIKVGETPTQMSKTEDDR